MWLTDDQLRARSRGEIRRPDTYSYRTFLPETGGLYCTKIFGAVNWTHDKRHIPTDDRHEHWGHIELPEPVRRLEGPATQVILVCPPVFRRFRELSAAEHREVASARRAKLIALAQTERWPYSDSLDKVLAEEGLDDPAAIDTLESSVSEPPLNVAYRTIVNAAHMLRRLIELDAPASVVDESRTSLVSACARVVAELERGDLPAPIKALALGRALD